MDVRGRKQQGTLNLHIEKLHNLYSLPDVTRVIKLRRMRWAGM
jgi:hypothetical protein